VAVVAAPGLSKRYRPVTTVDSVDLQVDTGEIYAPPGLNGAARQPRS
jgi:ABC-type multidrug transport system ATPase subunit